MSLNGPATWGNCRRGAREGGRKGGRGRRAPSEHTNRERLTPRLTRRRARAKPCAHNTVLPDPATHTTLRGACDDGRRTRSRANMTTAAWAANRRPATASKPTGTPVNVCEHSSLGVSVRCRGDGTAAWKHTRPTHHPGLVPLGTGRTAARTRRHAGEDTGGMQRAQTHRHVCSRSLLVCLHASDVTPPRRHCQCPKATCNPPQHWCHAWHAPT